MIQKGKKSFALRTVFIFIAFFVSYLFIWPQVDNFAFARETENSLKSLVDFSVGYGNGRFSGNLFATWISENFQWATLLIAVTLTAIVLLFNKIFLKNNKNTLLPVAVVFAVPSVGLIDECYFMTAGFCNYTLPVLFILISLLCIKTYETVSGIKKIAVTLLTFVSTFASCLFSENTTITVAFSSVLFLIICVKNKESVQISLINAVSAILSTITFILLPIITHSEHKLDSYRNIASGVKSTAVYAITNFSYFSKFFGEMTVITILLSVSMLCLIKKTTVSEKMKKFLSVTDILYIAVALFFAFFNTGVLNTAHIAIIEAVFTAIFFVCIFYTIVKIKDKKKSSVLILLFLVSASTVAPLMAVSVSGPRMYYLTFFVTLVFATTALKYSLDIESIIDKVSGTAVPVCTAVLSVISVVFLIQSVYNFDLYAMRSEYVKSEINETNGQISIPFVPCKSIHNENSSLKFGYSDDIAERLSFVELTSWEKYDDYKNATLTFPSAVKFAIDNIEYKNPANLE